MSNKKQTETSSGKTAYSIALLRSLQFSGVTFLRYMTVDVCNNVRAKVKPIDYLLSQANGLEHQVSVAEVCYGGLPYYADYMIEGTGMTAQNVLTIQPDLNSFRNLPYSPKSAVLLGNLVDQYTNKPSPLCTRGLLSKVVEDAKKNHNIAFSVGVELEFCLVNAKTGDFVDDSVFANTVTLNDQEEFLSELYDQLQAQYIPIELIHSESGPGQLEIVLKYSNNPIEMADNVLLAKETIRSVAHKYNCKALFLPKYDTTKAGNGMHVHMSIRNATSGQPLFCEGSTLTKQGSAFVEGILSHLPGLLGLTLPTVNSFRRIGPGCWTGSKVGWALEDKEAGIRVCSNLETKEWDHVELKLMDGSANLYLALAAILHSGVAGIAKNLQLRPMLNDESVSEPLPGSIIDALNALEQDETLQSLMGPSMSKAYLALRRHEVDHNQSSNMTLQDEIKASLSRS